MAAEAPIPMFPSFGFHVAPEIRQLMEDFAAAWGPIEPADKERLLRGCLSSTCTYLDPTTPAVVKGIDGMLEATSNLQVQMPEARIEVVGAFTDGERYVAQWVLIVPNGPLRIEGVELMTLKDGKLEQILAYFDRTPLIMETDQTNPPVYE